MLWLYLKVLLRIFLYMKQMLAVLWRILRIRECKKMLTVSPS